MRKFSFLLILLLAAMNAFAQQKIVTGTVTSKSTNEHLQGVSVQGKNKAVATDANGNFSIPAAVGETVTLSYVGMNAQNFKVTSSTQNYNIVMVEGVTDLNAVVVTG